MVQPSGYPPSQPYSQYPQQPPAPPGPYYGPQPPPAPKKSSGALIAIVIVVVVIVVLAIVGLVVLGVFTTPVTITGVNWTINYNGASSGYFGPSPQTACGACPLNEPAGGQFTYTLVLQSSALFLTHSIDTISIAAPFSLVLTSPSLPISVTPGGSATITMTIQVPSQGGSYVMAGTINTT